MATRIWMSRDLDCAHQGGGGESRKMCLGEVNHMVLVKRLRDHEQPTLLLYLCNVCNALSRNPFISFKTCISFEMKM